MSRFTKLSLFLLRLTLGWMFLYAGWSHLTNPTFGASLVGYTGHAKLLPGLYSWLGSLSFMPALNAWGLTLIGIALILGIFVRLASFAGAFMMLMYYLPLGFPYPNAHALIVDEHIIYIAGFLTLAALRAGRAWGLERWCASLPICSRYPKLRALFG